VRTHAGDGGRCRQCGVKIDWIADWRLRVIALDARPSESRRPTYVEVEMGEFVEVHRHECAPREPAQPYDGRDVRPSVEDGRDAANIGHERRAPDGRSANGRSQNAEPVGGRSSPISSPQLELFE
jgi:hypothetical protein